MLTLKTADGVTVFSVHGSEDTGISSMVPQSPVEGVFDSRLQGQVKVELTGQVCGSTSASSGSDSNEFTVCGMFTHSAMKFRGGQQNYVPVSTTAASSTLVSEATPMSATELRQRT